MKKSLLCSLILVLFFWQPLLVTAGGEIFVNGNLDSWSGGNPDIWVSNGTLIKTEETTRVRSGSSANLTHISGNPEYFRQSFVFNPGSNQVNFQAFIFDNDANIQARVCLIDISTYVSCSSYSTDQSTFQILVTSHDWGGNPSNNAHLTIEITGSGTGTIYVDDADFYAGVVISEFSDFLLIPIFLIAIVVPLYLVKKRKNR